MMAFLRLKLHKLNYLSFFVFFFTIGTLLGRGVPLVYADDCTAGSVQDCVDDLIHVTHTHISITSSIQAEIIAQQEEFNDNMTDTLKVLGVIAGVFIFGYFFNLPQFLFHK